MDKLNFKTRNPVYNALHLLKDFISEFDDETLLNQINIENFLILPH